MRRRLAQEQPPEQLLARELTAHMSPELNTALLWTLLSELNPKVQFRFAPLLKKWAWMEPTLTRQHVIAIDRIRQLNQSFHFEEIGMAGMLMAAMEVLEKLAQNELISPELYAQIRQALLNEVAATSASTMEVDDSTAHTSASDEYYGEN